MIERHACRAILLTPEEKVLLLEVREPATGWTAWIAPGGGVEPGEGHREALERELFEETGQAGLDPGPPIWLRDHTFTWQGRRVRQIETFYLVRTEPFSPHDVHQPDEGEAQAFQSFRWWRIEEIRGSSEVFVPRRLAGCLADLLREGIPDRPFDVGV